MDSSTLVSLLGIIGAGLLIPFAIIQIDHWDRRRRPQMYPAKKVSGPPAPVWAPTLLLIGSLCLLSAAGIGFFQIAAGPVPAGALIPYLMLVGWPALIIGNMLPKPKK
jgi:hypothetical protein